jgi:hypothetical protein
MAKIIGELGQIRAAKAVKSLRRMFLASTLGMALLALIAGFSLATALFSHRFAPWLLVVELGFLGIGAYWIDRWATRSLGLHEQERLRWRKDALGKATVSFVLEALPDDYIVFNDFCSHSNRVDHIVIGPSGIFVLDTKNWRGTITPDGRGEVLCDGKFTGQYEVKELLTTIQSLREKINILTHRDDFIQGILAFPLARVEARWGTSRNVHCLTDDRLLDYIEKYQFSRRLKQSEVELIEKAFQAIAGMESGFDPADGALIILPLSK